MADTTVAMNALKVFGADRSAAGHQFVDEVSVAAQAGLLENARFARLDPDGLFEIHEGEALRVPEAVLRLGEILRHEVVGQMAFHAGGRLMVSPLLPRVILIVHDVAVGAGPRVLGEVAQAFTVIEGVKAQARRHPHQNRGTDDDRLPGDLGQHTGSLATRPHGVNRIKECFFLNRVRDHLSAAFFVEADMTERRFYRHTGLCIRIS